MPRPENTPDFKINSSRSNKKSRPVKPKLPAPRAKERLFIVALTKYEWDGLLHWLANVPTQRSSVALDAIQKFVDAYEIEA